MVVSESVPPEFTRHVERLRADGLLPPEAVRASGEVGQPIRLDRASAVKLMRVSALRAAGFFRPTRRTTIAWVDGANQLAIQVAELDLVVEEGQVVVLLPVRCDQAEGTVRVTFVLGSPERPRGLYAATERRPRGPEVVVETWGDHLVAFAWQCLLGLYTGMAGASGKDSRGNYLVPVEVTADSEGLAVVPMGRHRFSGSSGLLTGSGR